MNFLSLKIVIFTLFLLTSGCAVKQTIDFEQKNLPIENSGATYSVNVNVQDHRPYVQSGKKESCFIGIYRASFGNPWDVRTKNNIPVFEMIQNDLLQRLRMAGANVKTEKSERIIRVTILDYNFDCYLNCRVWYRLLVSVIDIQGNTLASDEISKEIIVSGSAWTGPKSAMEAKMPIIYGEMLDFLSLKNTKIWSAIKIPGQ